MVIIQSVDREKIFDLIPSHSFSKPFVFISRIFSRVFLGSIRSHSANGILELVYSANQRKVSRQLDLSVDKKFEWNSGVKGFMKLALDLLSCLVRLKGLGVIDEVAFKKQPAYYLLGCYLAWKINRFAPRKLVLYNDHSLITLVMIDTLRYFKIKTIFIQHGVVSDRFPSLYSDINILFSQRSKEIYKLNEGTLTVVISDARFWESRSCIKYSDNSRIVIFGLGLYDDLKDVYDLNEVLSKGGYELLVKCHPREKRRLSGLDTILSLEELTTKRVRACLAGESGVLLDFCVMGIPTCHVKVKRNIAVQRFDIFDFVKSGLIPGNYLPSEIMRFFEEFSFPNSDRLEYYVGDLGKRHEHKEFVRNLISS